MSTPRRPALEGRVVAGGRTSRQWVARVLGLEADDAPWMVRSVAWVNHGVEASVGPTDGSHGDVVFRIERRTDDSRGLITTRHLVLYFRTDDSPRELVDLVRGESGDRLAGVTLEQIADQLAADPELGKPGLSMPATVDEGERPRSLLDTWGGDAFADFFAGGEMARSQLDSLDHTALFTFVQHSDAECAYVNPHSPARVTWLVNYPWEGPLRRAGTSAGARDPTDILDQLVTTDLNENDVIMGNPGKLERALRYAAGRHGVNGKTVFFSNTCVPAVVGEDVESCVDRNRTESGCPMLYLTVTPRSMVNVFQDILVDRRLEAERRAQPAHPNAVNFVGFEDGQARDELTRLLAELGIEVNCCLLPDVSDGLVDRLPRGALNVLLPNQLWQHLYDQVTISSSTPHLSIQAPYGVRATRGWVQAIVEALGVRVDVEARWRALFEPFAGDWARLRQEAAAHRLALVVRSGETYHLTKPAATWGVAIVETLEEMGFALDVLVKVDDRKDASRAVVDLRGAFRYPDRHSIKAFNSLETLLARLSRSEAEAVFSAHFFDWRVTSTGKNLFSLQHFEMGVAGALRTGRRLLGVCRTPFYRQYSRYLRRTRSGLRPAAPTGNG